TGGSRSHRRGARPMTASRVGHVSQGSQGSQGSQESRGSLAGRAGQAGRAALKSGAAAILLAAGAQAFGPATAQTNPNAPSNFVKVQAPVIALTHARVIDGTGAAPREDQTLVIRDGNIADVGRATSLAVPPGATTIDLSGKTVIPGLVMMHEHLSYTTGPAVYGQLGASFTRLTRAG